MNTFGDLSLLNSLKGFLTFCIGDKMCVPETEVKQDDAIFELVGVLLGDGYIYFRPPWYRIEISGNSTEDLPYFQDYLLLLLQNLSGREVHLRRCYDKKGSSIRLVLNSKKFVTHLVKEIGLVYGKRKAELAEVPDGLLSAGWKMTRLILRGFADTDGSLFFGRKGTYRKYLYPTIELKSVSIKLLKQFKVLLQSSGFAPRLRRGHKSKASVLYLSGRKQLSMWINEIGFSNPKHLTKYQVWKKIGYCPPRTTLRDRLQILLTEPGWPSR